MTDEVWKPIPDFPGYFISSVGKIGSTRTGSFKLLSTAKGKNGYLHVPLFRDGKWFTRMPHRLVLEAFVGSCPVGMECDHINAIRDDNRVENLCWVTRGENLRNPITKERRVKSRKSCPLVCVETGEVFPSLKEAGRRLGVHHSNVARVCRGNSRHLHGLHFRFVGAEDSIDKQQIIKEITK